MHPRLSVVTGTHVQGIFRVSGRLLDQLVVLTTHQENREVVYPVGDFQRRDIPEGTSFPKGPLGSGYAATRNQLQTDAAPQDIVLGLPGRVRDLLKERGSLVVIPQEAGSVGGLKENLNGFKIEVVPEGTLPVLLASRTRRSRRAGPELTR